MSSVMSFTKPVPLHSLHGSIRGGAGTPVRFASALAFFDGF